MELDFTDYYNDLASDKNNLSYWYPRVKDCGLLTPRTLILKVPEEVVKATFMDHVKKDVETVYKWVVDVVMPTLETNNMTGLLFVKNGSFSNKFNFKDCAILANPHELTMSIININYQSFCFGAGGNTELIIRERINSDSRTIPCIYNGMPLNTEYRIFYDFDNHKALYAVNYWDYDYCHDIIAHNATDKIVFEAYYPTLEKRYNENVDCVIQGVSQKLKNVTGLSGIWSVDILQDYKEHFWLIDMAIAQQSAYWNPEKIIKEN